jgi:hypothetical protein
MFIEQEYIQRINFEIFNWFSNNNCDSFVGQVPLLLGIIYETEVKESLILPEMKS